MGISCIRGCTLRDNHLSDCEGGCRGCLPRPSDEGLLCKRCYRRLSTLLGPPENLESLAGAIRWLQSNKGQYLRSSNGGSGTGDGSTYGDHMVAAISHSHEITQSLLELAQDFSGENYVGNGVHLYLNLWKQSLANWEPIGDHLDHLEALIQEAHSISPWRAKQDRTLHTAALLFLLPPEPVSDLAQRFEVKESWIKSRMKGKEHRPWDVFKLLCPEASLQMEADLINYSGPLKYQTGN